MSIARRAGAASGGRIRARRIHRRLLRRPRRVGARYRPHRDRRILRRRPRYAVRRRPGETTLVNTLETISLRSKDRRVAYVVTQPDRIEAPNWFPDATNTLYFNNGGKLFKVQAEPPGTPPNPNRLKVPEAGQSRHADAHQQRSRRLAGWHAVGDQRSVADRQRPASVAHLHGAGRRRTQPKRLTEQGPSYFHGWSPDGKTLDLLRRAQRQLRCLHDLGRWRRGEALDDGRGERRRPGILARRPVHLLQFRADRRDADLADEGRTARNRNR